MYAYQNLERPDFFKNIRTAASKNYRGITAVIDEKVYLVIDQKEGTFILEDQEGNRQELQHFEYTARNEQDALVAASRVTEPFTPGSKIGDWTIGNLAFNEGNWHVRNGDSDQIVPIETLVQMLEDVSYFKDEFNSNFEVYLSPVEKRAAKTASMKKVAVTIETNLPNAGWHNGAVMLANQLGLEAQITYPDGTTLDAKSPANFMASFKACKMLGLPVNQANQVPITVETDNPELFWEVWEDKSRRGGMGGQRERFAATLPDTPGEHFLDTMDVTSDRKDYEHWNEDADYMWWEEEGKHQDQEPLPGYDDYHDRPDVDREGEFEMAVDDGYEAAFNVPPDVLTWEYLPNTNDRDVLVAFLDSYQNGQSEQGFEGLTHEEYQRLIEEALRNYAGPFIPSYGSSGWTRQAITDIESVGTPTDIPYDPSVEQDVVHAYPDGDIILQDGTTTFNPERAYGFLVGQKEFDKAQQVKELIDRSPPSELPPAAIPPEERQQPQTQLPGEAPLDPTGGEPVPATGAPMQPGAEVPPPPAAPVRPRASVEEKIEFAASKEARKDFTHSEQKALINENLEGRARNYDKLNLKGTHYEIDQESSIESFLWQ